MSIFQWFLNCICRLHTGFTIPTSAEGAGDSKVKVDSSLPKTSANKSSSPAPSTVKPSPTSSSSKVDPGAESSTPKSSQSSQSTEKKEEKLGGL